MLIIRTKLFNLFKIKLIYLLINEIVKIFTMNQFNNLRFTLKNYNYEQDPTQWIQHGQTVNYQDNTHGKILFKNKTADIEFIKCPVNPQQTSFKYIKLNKKSMTIDDVYMLINYFYYVGNKFTPFNIENTLDIEDDGQGVHKSIRENINSELYSWSSFLINTIKFKEIIQIETYGYKTYQLVLEQ